MQMRAVISANQSVQFIDIAGSGVVMVLSAQQIAILRAAQLAGGRLPDPGQVLGFAPDARLTKTRGTRTPTQRAALSRSLRRLAAEGLIEKPLSVGATLTEQGRAFTVWLFEEWEYEKAKATHW